MIKIVAIDDEIHALERFERMVLEIKELKLCGLFETANELLDYINNNQVDAVFLDIEMPEINGLQLAEKILDIDKNIDIIFVTAFNQYAVEAFELQAMDYLMKPLIKERLNKTVERLLKKNKIEYYENKLVVQCFGNFEVFIEGEAIGWKNSKAKEILAFLVQSKGIPLTWERIANAVWPNYDAEKSQTNFHANTYLLRKRLSELGISNILENKRGNYRVLIDKINCDFYDFEEIVKKGFIETKEEMFLVEKAKKEKYMNEDGYIWSYSKNVQLSVNAKDLLKNKK